MAAKTPDSVTTHSIGSLFLTVAVFETENIDDNDTWASGIQSAVLYGFEPTLDGPQDTCMDAYSSGTFTFGSEANATGFAWVMHKGY